MKKWSWLTTSFALAACSSTPTVQEPAWIKEPTRIVDNGYIVYTGTAEDIRPERAQFKAEGLALEDLANECSFIPKGTRIEDRFSQQDRHVYKAYVKIGLEFTECEKAKQAQDPQKIRELGNVAFTEQLKKYQDLNETGEMGTEVAQVEPSTEGTPPARGTMSDSMHFYVVRQYVAYEKEVVILAPPTAYAPSSPETQHLTAVMRPAVAQIDQYQTANPTLKTQPEAWSKLPEKPNVPRPTSLAARPPVARAFKAMKGPKPLNARAPAPTPAKKRRRRH